MKKKNYWLGILFFVCFFLPISLVSAVGTKNSSWLDGDLKQLLLLDSPGVVTNELRGFELEASKVGVADQKLAGAYFEMIKMTNQDKMGNLQNQFTQDDYFSMYKSENEQHRSVVKTGANGTLTFDSLYRVFAELTYDHAFSSLENDALLWESADKSELLAQDEDAESYLTEINQNSVANFDIGFYLIHEIWAPIGDFSPALSEKKLYRRYDRDERVWLVRLYVDSSGNPQAEARSGKLVEKKLGNQTFYSLEKEEGESVLLIQVGERIKANLGLITNKLRPNFSFKITKKNQSKEVIRESSAQFGAVRIVDDELQDLLAAASREGDEKLPSQRYPLVSSRKDDKNTENGVVTFNDLKKERMYVFYELKAPDGYIREEQKAYFVYFDESENYSFEKLGGVPIVFEGVITRGENGHAKEFQFKKKLSSQFDLKPIMFTFDAQGESLTKNLDGLNTENQFTVYVPQYLQALEEGVEKWKALNLSTYIAALQVEFPNFTFTVNEQYGLIGIDTHGYGEANFEKRVTNLLRKESNYVPLAGGGTPSGSGSWVDISYDWIQKEGTQEYWRDPNSYVIGMDFVNVKPVGGFLPSTGKIFTKPIVWIVLGILVAMIALVIYRNVHSRSEEL